MRFKQPGAALVGAQCVIEWHGQKRRIENCLGVSRVAYYLSVIIDHPLSAGRLPEAEVLEPMFRRGGERAS